MKRNTFDLSHQSHMCGRIGALQTLSTTQVVAGDSMSMSLNGLARLSPLRRNMTVDCRFDLFIFYVPHRHIYSNWKEFIQGGVDGTETLKSQTITTQSQGYYGEGQNPDMDESNPVYLIAGYIKIWNRYFRVPGYENVREDTSISVSTTGLQVGISTAHMKTIWSTGIKKGLTAADSDITVTNNKISLLDINKINARYKTETEREWFSTRYADIMRAGWGTNVNTDADERPTLIMRKNTWLSGYDVDGTSDTTLGQYSGKAMGAIDISMPRRFFPEHGTLWVMCVPRFPALHEGEKSYLSSIKSPSYKEIACDYEQILNEPPRDQNVGAYMNTDHKTGWETDKKEAYGQWYRHNAHRIHHNFTRIQGYPFLKTRRSTQIHGDDYNHMFTSLQLHHWQAHCTLQMQVFRRCPTTRESIYAGALR